MADDTATDAQVLAQSADDGEKDKPDAPQRWVWADMGLEEREQRLTELVEWVDWLVETYELRNQVARCWFRHSRLIELFSALFIGWVRTYVGDPTKLSIRAELDWIKELYALLPLLNSASCQAAHVDPPASTYSMRAAFDAWLTERERPFLDAPRSHPAQTQATKLAKAKRLEDAARAKAKEAGTGRNH
ncbi:hypothetical protein [Streptomyces olivaceoviridis]|uniref:hypothetical protein n=1 Tax=Streptomyces olivaceoviridis TaxID=1921 RepID=UPI003324DB78